MIGYVTEILSALQPGPLTRTGLQGYIKNVAARHNDEFDNAAFERALELLLSQRRIEKNPRGWTPSREEEYGIR